MRTILLSTLLLSLTNVPAWAQISGSSDIDQKGSSRPVYGQNPQASKMTPGGSKGQAGTAGMPAAGASGGAAAQNDAAAGSGSDGSLPPTDRPRPAAKGDRHGSGADRPPVTPERK